MSHFSVLVTGNDVATALQPFHEFECTGKNDQYVQEIDLTDEVKEQFAKDTTAMLRDGDGKLHSFFDEKGNWRQEFSKPVTDDPFPTGRRVKHVPTGFVEVDVPTSEVESFAQWIDGYYGWSVAKDEASVDRDDTHKYGYVIFNDDGSIQKAVDRTNPNKKWDWWQVGGRWSNRLTLKSGQKADVATSGEVDWDGMVRANADKAAAEYDKIVAIIAGRDMPTWRSLYAKVEAKEITIDEARATYNDHPVKKDLIAAAAIDEWNGAEQLDAVLSAPDRATYIKQISERRSCMFALLHDGQWLTAGDMGWFGMGSDTPDSRLVYAAKFFEIVRNLPDDMPVTVVDCHI